METTATKLDTFTTAYIECALWSSTNEDGQPLDDDFDESDLAPETMAKMIADCQAFQSENADDLNACGLGMERQGHDFWLTRNRHGAGFWDHGNMGEQENAALKRLTDAAHLCGTVDLYAGDDGMIYSN
jgi:hypothetical protein